MKTHVDPERLKRAVIALFDHGSREGATAAKVRKAMKDEGFTASEIAAAAEEMK